MIWSISSFRIFQECRRKWYYNEKFASRSLKDSNRREAYILSQLRSIDAWRGTIVDDVISKHIIPDLAKKRRADKSSVIETARKITKSRYDFAKNKTYREEGLKKGDYEEAYAALFAFEYETGLNLNEKFKKAWEDIEIALSNFLANEELLNELKSAQRLIPQRALQYQIHGFTVKGIPDLIAFFSNKAPHIYDWKVHFEGTKTYTDQLLLYAVALGGIIPHVDFPAYRDDYSVLDYQLKEVQLLKNQIRHYEVTEEEIERINDDVADCIYQMNCAECHLPFEKLDIEDFDRTDDPSDCETCPFKKICHL